MMYITLFEDIYIVENNEQITKIIIQLAVRPISPALN